MTIVNYDVTCLKLEKMIEAIADKVTIKKSPLKSTDKLIRIDESEDIRTEILDRGFKYFIEVLEKKKQYYNGYNLILEWHEKPKFKYGIHDCFLMINFSLIIKGRTGFKTKYED